uniref:DDE Tnp4 domain-containing protein n=1 Tax=Timema monikensis TaxID=170555 RepID=A0A7R9EIB2_9NEOP|nr:unnamed protein product [Timema monikensis]
MKKQVESTETKVNQILNNQQEILRLLGAVRMLCKWNLLYLSKLMIREGEGCKEREGRRSERTGCRATCRIASKFDVAGRSNYLPLFLASLGFDARWRLSIGWLFGVRRSALVLVCCSSSRRFDECPPFDLAITHRFEEFLETRGFAGYVDLKPPECSCNELLKWNTITITITMACSDSPWRGAREQLPTRIVILCGSQIKTGCHVTPSSETEKRIINIGEGKQRVACGAHLKIVDIVARRPGSFHDASLSGASSLRSRFEQGRVEGILLGDSGYPCLPYLLTPLLNARTESEQRYNAAHIATRNPVERLFGSLISTSNLAALKACLSRSSINFSRIQANHLELFLMLQSLTSYLEQAALSSFFLWVSCIPFSSSSNFLDLNSISISTHVLLLEGRDLAAHFKTINTNKNK